MFRSKSINQCFIVLTLFVTSQIHQLQGAQSAAAAAAPSPKQTLTPENQAAANASLFEAVKSGDVNSINKALDAGAQVNAKDENGKTPLYWAIVLGKTKAMDNLLFHGADSNVLLHTSDVGVEHLSEDPFKIGAGLKKEYWNLKHLGSNKSELRRMYIDYQTGKDKESFLEVLEGKSRPHEAYEAMHMVTIKFLLQKGIPLVFLEKYLRLHLLPPDLDDTSDFKELEKKVKAREYIKIMNSKQDPLEKQEQINEVNKRWENRFKEQVNHQLQTQRAAAAESSPEQTLQRAAANEKLFEAVKADNIVAAQAAIAQGADLNARDKDGKTLLYKEALNDDIRSVNTLLSLGAELPPKSMWPQQELSGQQQTMVDDKLLAAVESGKIGNIIIAIIHGANLDIYRYRKTLLELAVKNNNLSVVKVLLNYGANPNETDGIFTILHDAVEENKLGVVNLLLDYGADPNPGPDSTICPLLTAVEPTEQGDNYDIKVNIVKALLKAGANPKVRNSYALIVAVKRGNSDMVKALLDYGADPDVLLNPHIYVSGEQLLKIPLFAGLKKEYWNPENIDSWTDLLLRRMYINYQTGKDKKNESEKKNEPDKNEQKKEKLPEYKTFLEILEGQTGSATLAAKARSIVTPQFWLQKDIPPKALEQYLLNATPHAMLQKGVPFEMQQEYLRSHVLSPYPEDVGTTRDFETLETSVKAKESQEIIESKQDLSEQQEQLQKLNERWKNRLEEQETRQRDSNHAEFLKALDEKHKKVEQALLEKAREGTMGKE